MSELMSKDLKDTIEDLDKNITLLKETEEFNVWDAKTLITTIFEVLKDLLQKFEPLFIKMEELMGIEKASVKGEKYSENQVLKSDIKNLYL